jgi:hypothetical protein
VKELAFGRLGFWHTILTTIMDTLQGDVVHTPD